MIQDNILNLINLEISNQQIEDYKNSQPFPSIVIENLVKNTNFLKLVEQEFKTFDIWGCDPFCVKHQVKKFFFPYTLELVNSIPFLTKGLIDAFNSSEMLKFLEKLTGIKNLIADPSLYGAGMHKIDSGGKLDIHADYSKHSNYPLYRRVNLLLYINSDWDTLWGGELELRNKDMILIKSIAPLFNRAVIFNTTSRALHGHPIPLNCPPGVSRFSIAMYYFTEEAPEDSSDENTSALWFSLPEQGQNS